MAPVIALRSNPRIFSMHHLCIPTCKAALPLATYVSPAVTGPELLAPHHRPIGNVEGYSMSMAIHNLWAGQRT